MMFQVKILEDNKTIFKSSNKKIDNIFDDIKEKFGDMNGKKKSCLFGRDRD